MRYPTTGLSTFKAFDKFGANWALHVQAIETTFKLAIGLVSDLHKQYLQCSGRLPVRADVDRCVYSIRELARFRPKMVSVATDIKNVFGALVFWISLLPIGPSRSSYFLIGPYWSFQVRTGPFMSS